MTMKERASRTRGQHYTLADPGPYLAEAAGFLLGGGAEIGAATESCLSDVAMARLVEGTADQSERRSADLHLETCGRCSNILLEAAIVFGEGRLSDRPHAKVLRFPDSRRFVATDKSDDADAPGTMAALSSSNLAAPAEELRTGAARVLLWVDEAGQARAAVECDGRSLSGAAITLDVLDRNGEVQQQIVKKTSAAGEARLGAYSRMRKLASGGRLRVAVTPAVSHKKKGRR